MILARKGRTNPMEELAAKIQRLSLTHAERRIAEYILEHLDTIGLQTSTALAQDIGVSDTSIIRFIRKLGFKGYSEFRSEMADRIARHYSQTQPGLSPGEKYIKSREFLHQNSLLQDVQRYTLDNLQKSFAKLEMSTVDRVADIILASRRKFVAGFRGAACCAQYMSSKLLFLVPDVLPVLHADATALERLVDISSSDCLIVYSFPRYSELNFVLMDMAQEQGAKIILFTDQVTSPLANRADVVITACVGGLGFTNSYAVPLSLTEAVLLALSSRRDEGQEKRMDHVDKLVGENQLY